MCSAPRSTISWPSTCVRSPSGTGASARISGKTLLDRSRNRHHCAMGIPNRLSVVEADVQRTADGEIVVLRYDFLQPDFVGACCQADLRERDRGDELRGRRQDSEGSRHCRHRSFKIKTTDRMTTTFPPTVERSISQGGGGR